MGCIKSLDFAVAGGAHLSFYWTMDEAGTADKVDSAQGLHWPLEFGAAAGVGLFSNGTDCDNPIILNNQRGLGLFNSASLAVNQAVSKGLGVWFWVKLVAYGAGITGAYIMDDTGAHTNRFRVIFNFSSAVHGSMELDHTNDTNLVFVDTPNLNWPLGGWHMVAITYDKVAQTINIYIDGALSGTTADPLVYLDISTADMFLHNFANPGDATDFITDECGLCLNGPLTQAQVTALYNGGAGVTWPGVNAIVPYP